MLMILSENFNNLIEMSEYYKICSLIFDIFVPVMSVLTSLNIYVKDDGEYENNEMWCYYL